MRNIAEVGAESILTSYEVGYFLQVNPSSVNKWVKEGLLKSYRTPGKHRRIQVADLMVFLAAQEMFIPKGLQQFVANEVPVIRKAPPVEPKSPPAREWDTQTALTVNDIVRTLDVRYGEVYNWIIRGQVDFSLGEDGHQRVSILSLVEFLVASKRTIPASLVPFVRVRGCVEDTV